MEKKCKAKLSNGKPCKLKAIFGDYCNIHFNIKLKSEIYLKEMKHGRT